MYNIVEDGKGGLICREKTNEESENKFWRWLVQIKVIKARTKIMKRWPAMKVFLIVLVHFLAHLELGCHAVAFAAPIHTIKLHKVRKGYFKNSENISEL